MPNVDLAKLKQFVTEMLLDRHASTLSMVDEVVEAAEHLAGTSPRITAHDGTQWTLDLNEREWKERLQLQRTREEGEDSEGEGEGEGEETTTTI